MKEMKEAYSTSCGDRTSLEFLDVVLRERRMSGVDIRLLHLQQDMDHFLGYSSLLVQQL